VSKDGLETKVAVIVEKVTNIESKLNKIEVRLDSEFVTRGEMGARVALLENNIVLLQKIVYGIVAIVLTGVVGAILSLVLR
jgi:hypothetical protein